PPTCLVPTKTWGPCLVPTKTWSPCLVPTKTWGLGGYGGARCRGRTHIHRRLESMTSSRRGQTDTVALGQTHPHVPIQANLWFASDSASIRISNGSGRESWVTTRLA